MNLTPEKMVSRGMDISNPRCLLVRWLDISLKCSAWRQYMKDKLASGHPSLPAVSFRTVYIWSLKIDQCTVWIGPFSTK